MNNSGDELAKAIINGNYITNESKWSMLTDEAKDLV